jgi:hypothetical protein
MIHRSRSSATRRETEPEGDQFLAVTLARTIWDNLPLLLVIDAALAFAAFPALLAGGFGALYLAPLLAALMMGPLWIGAISVSRRLLDGDGVTVRHFARAVRELGWLGVRVAIVPGGLMTLLLATLELSGRNAGQGWMLLPAAMDGLLALGAIVLFFPASLLAASERDTGRTLWKRAALLAGLSPMATLGLIAGLATVWIIAQFAGPLAIVLLAAPIALFSVAVFRWALMAHGIERER